MQACNLTRGTIVLDNQLVREVAKVEQGRRNHRVVTYVGGQQVEVRVDEEIPTATDGPRAWSVCYITRDTAGSLSARWQVWKHGEKARHGEVESRPLQTDTFVEDEVRVALMGLDRNLWDHCGEYRMVFTDHDPQARGVLSRVDRAARTASTAG